MSQFGFVGPGYASQSPQLDSERLVNLYTERVGADGGAHGKADWALLATPGLKLFATLPTGPVRCLWSGDNRVFAVGGSKLYEVLRDGTIAPGTVGDVGSATTPAQIFSNGNQLFVVSGAQGYLADGSDGTNVVPVVAAVQGGYLDGFFLAQDPNSNSFHISSPLDGSMWDPLDFGTKEGAPDRLSAILADHEELWLFGQKTTEVWYNSGAANFPFTRITGAFVEQGIWAPFSAVKLDNSIFWLGGDDRGIGIVWRAQGYTPVRVSNQAIEFAIQSYPVSTDAIAYAYQDQGHSFYVLHFPTAGKTWVYDVATQQWHERAYWDVPSGRYQAHLGRFHCYAFGGGQGTSAFSPGKHLVGDYRNGNIYQQDISFFDDNGNPKRWLRSCPHITDELKWYFYHRIKVDMQVGGSKVFAEPFLAAGNQPHISLRWSDDGGMSWSDPRIMDIAKIGDTRFQVYANQLGRSRDRVFEVTGEDPIQVVILNAYLKASAGLPDTV